MTNNVNTTIVFSSLPEASFLERPFLTPECGFGSPASEMSVTSAPTESGNTTPATGIEAAFMSMSDFLALHELGNNTPDTECEANIVKMSDAQAPSQSSITTPEFQATIPENNTLATSGSNKTTPKIESQATLSKSNFTPKSKTAGATATPTPEKDIQLHPALGIELSETERAKPSMSLLNELQQFGVVKIRYDSLGFYSAENGEEAAWVESVTIESTFFEGGSMEYMGHASTKKKAKEMAATKAFNEQLQLRKLLRSLPIKCYM